MNVHASIAVTTQRRHRLYMGALLACLALAGAIKSANAADLMPWSVFVQEGIGDQKTQATVIGITWNLPWDYEFRFGTLRAYTEAAVGRWHTAGRNGTTSWPTQISVVPNLRFYPSHSSNWFAEIGVGPSYIVPLFRTSHRRFSTEFNFDDHIAVGRDFGSSEVSVRAEHFSNAGISHPNPGENFVQVRYAYRF